MIKDLVETAPKIVKKTKYLMKSVGYVDASHRGGVRFSARQQPLRRLHGGHFAFMRAVVQGLDTRASWDRYLRVEGAHHDTRQVKRTIEWIRDAFAAAAKRHHRHGTARLVLMDLAVLRQQGNMLPSLDDYVRAHDLHDFSEEEQLGFYRRHYGAAARQKGRHARLVGRQLDALNWLQEVAAQPPRGDDPISSWLHPLLAGHLARAGLTRLHQLVHRIEQQGARWWVGIDAIGTNKARRITDWLRAHQDALASPAPDDTGSLAGGAVSFRKPRPSTIRITDAVIPPLRDFPIPAHLDGRDGTLRAPPASCKIAASTDIDALLVWLDTKGNQSSSAAVPSLAGINQHEPRRQRLADRWAVLRTLSHTQRAYWKEAERFMLWLLRDQQATLSSVTSDQCVAYRAFLKRPGPDWCGPRGRDKSHPEWRPFEGPLGETAQRFAVTVLRSLYRYLVDHAYLAANPWEGGGRLPPRAHRQPVRHFGDAEWDVIERALSRLPVNSVNERLAFALRWIHATNLKIGEAVRSRLGDLQPVPDVPGAWQLKVVSPDGRSRLVPMPPAVMVALRAYLARRGLDTNVAAAANREVHFLGKATDATTRAPWAPCAQAPIDARIGIGPGSMRDQIKAFFMVCAEAARDQPALQVQFKAASSGWLRAASGCTST